MNVTVYKSKDKPFVVYPFFLLLFEQSEICFLFVVAVALNLSPSGFL
jgi:hypothetical protein